MQIICLLSSSRRLCVSFFYFSFQLIIERVAYKERCVRYIRYRVIPPVYTAGITGTGHFGRFGTTSIPVSDTSVSSVQHQYRYQTLRYVRFDIDIGTGHFGMFGTTSMPIPDTSVSSVRYGYRYRWYRYRLSYRYWTLG